MIDGELVELVKQVGWHMGEDFKKDLRRAIEKYGQRQYGDGYNEGRHEESWLRD